MLPEDLLALALLEEEEELGSSLSFRTSRSESSELNAAECTGSGGSFSSATCTDVTNTSSTGNLQETQKLATELVGKKRKRDSADFVGLMARVNKSFSSLSTT